MGVSIRDVAATAGVSVGTVSNVLNRPDSVPETTLDRVRAAIAELGYVRNDAARQLRAGRSTTVGLVVLDARNPFFSDLARGADDEAAKHGLSVLIGNSDEQLDRELRLLSLFEEQRAHGVLISPIGDELERLRELRERGIPVVLVDRTAPGSGFSSVAVDDVRGGRLAARHLLDAGHRRLAYAGGPAELRQVADRAEGARAEVASVEGATLDILPVESLTVAEGIAAGERIAALDPAQRPEAVFAANDLIALGLLQALTRAGISVPEDVALIGYDDIDFAAAAAVPLSSIRQPSLTMGATALAILADEAADPAREPRDVLFDPELVVRASTGG
ncbi:LacI family DNA-binding transcriptional regulator [Microbacterium stercoris]|uniref:LacI family DNA-binding transcriptional regulator n=1 Tax=Microbacterium stercoris TaxID=2820289 RepID=A0A939QFR3_9MICO|nr:LacI family DNA-binding transcriptional regulator [Microbacterium stercoris]MBO3662104.1 LacI family DNA-binding transcriptional regulator [Microbacterium stercoris]